MEKTDKKYGDTYRITIFDIFVVTQRGTIVEISYFHQIIIIANYYIYDLKFLSILSIFNNCAFRRSIMSNSTPGLVPHSNLISHPSLWPSLAFFHSIHFVCLILHEHKNMIFNFILSTVLNWLQYCQLYYEDLY